MKSTIIFKRDNKNAEKLLHLKTGVLYFRHLRTLKFFLSNLKDTKQKLQLFYKKIPVDI